MAASFSDFVRATTFDDLPSTTIRHAKRSLIDLLGVAAAGSQTKLAKIIATHANEQFGSASSNTPILFSNLSASPAGAALAGGMCIDAVDAHDGYKPAKGHVGCGLLPAILAFAHDTGLEDGQEFLAQLVIGYEIASRAAEALHATAPDYHTSGAWIAVACAAIGARALGLDHEQMRHAIGIAEYHGPRSQMMRVIDHPSMLKDGSGWGAMAGVSAAYLARDGFTGAPAITVENDNVEKYWSDLGERWLVGEQYFKPYPVCRWAQPPVIAALDLIRRHKIVSDDIDHIEVTTFHEACRLATSKPQTTEEAQYSLPFPVASAVVHGELSPTHIDDDYLHDPETLRLSTTMRLNELEEYNAVFPAKRLAHVAITLKNGKQFRSPPTEAIGDPEAPLTDERILDKFYKYAKPVLGSKRCDEISKLVDPGDFNKIELIELSNKIYI